MEPDAVDEVGRVEHGGEADVLDFSANTNPETPEGVADVYRSALADAQSYPPDLPAEFRVAAADCVGCSRQEVLPMPGGLAGIRLTAEVTLTPGDSALLPAPSFGEYSREVRLQGAEPVFVDHDAVLDADPSEHEMAVVCHPNNPTGEAYDDAALREFASRCRESDTRLLVDEAFLDFTDRPSLAGTEGVVVARSLTKMFGLPGIRAGFLAATGEMRRRLGTARQTWNLGAPAIAVGEYCLTRREFVEQTRARVRAERDRMAATLGEAFDVFDSAAPFLLLDIGERSVDAVLEAARDDGIAVRDARSFRGLDSHIRVAVRLPRENDRLLEVLGDV
ncbi:L-threonine O-3-phosphate decarboxylase [Halovenus aranensis]|uniref:Aminotransferase n=1 Tax=Halovenus aranensis TaxID=890420 RepID=A0A1G8UAI5_9EURY|nr:threonine-phosphate decarboxylase [Halovenus aranensis]SDJ50624.1 L-threonine O-3-phosphate decarboxylase [Halovenus aranensis]